jgi:hypothetical protein
MVYYHRLSVIDFESLEVYCIVITGVCPFVMSLCEAFFMLWVCNNSMIPCGHSAVFTDGKSVACLRRQNFYLECIHFPL